MWQEKETLIALNTFMRITFFYEGIKTHLEFIDRV